MKSKFKTYYDLSNDDNFSVLLNESPMRLGNIFQTDLTLFSKNIQITERIINDPSTVYVDEISNHKIYNVFNNKNGIISYYIAQYNGKYHLTDGYTVGKIVNNEYHEYLIWQDEHQKGLVRKFYLDYLIPKYHTLVSDDSHTTLGENFWIKLANESMIKGYKILARNSKTLQTFIIDNTKLVERFFGDDRYIDWHIIIKDN